MSTELTPRLKLAIGRDTAALRHWVHSELGREYMNWWMLEVDPTGKWERVGSNSGEHSQVRAFINGPSDKGVVATTLSPSKRFGGMARSIVQAAPRAYKKAVHGRMYYVTPEMGDQAARRMVRRTAAFIQPHELITPTGIVWLPVTGDMNFQKQEAPTKQEDITPAIAWNLDGDKITIFWICDGAWNHASNSIRWLASDGFWSDSEFEVNEVDSMLMNRKEVAPPPGITGETEFEQILDLAVNHAEMWQIWMSEAQEAWKGAVLSEEERDAYLGTNGPQRLIPYHFWSPRTDISRDGVATEENQPLLRPDQPGAPASDEFGEGRRLWWNKNGTSTQMPFPHEPETDEEIGERTAKSWTMIAFACEIIRMLGEDYLYAEDAYPSQGASRNIQRGLKKRGIDKNTALRVYTLRKPVEEGLRREGRYLSRGPLTTRHHRQSHWRGNQGKAGDRTCRHEYRAHRDEYDWRICDECGRVEHRVTDTDVGPEHAPFIKDRSIGVLRR